MLSFKVARTSFLARGIDHHRASRVRTRTIEARDLKLERPKQILRRATFFLPKVTFVLLETKFAYEGGLPAEIT